MSTITKLRVGAGFLPTRAAIPPSPRCSYTSRLLFHGFSAAVSQPESSDTHFFNSFSVVLGILIAFTICLFAFARGLGRDYQLRDVRDDPILKQEIKENTTPFAREAIGPLRRFPWSRAQAA